MKSWILSALFFLLFWHFVYPQSFDYGNAWYNSNVDYLQLKVWEDGVYRVTAADLQAAGANLSGLTPGNIHLIYREEEAYIHVEETGGQLDFIEFYGKRNDGDVDSLMYHDPWGFVPNLASASTLSPNQRLSLYSDTSTYYLFWDNLPGRRLSPFQNTNYGAFSPETGFAYEAYLEFHPDQGGVYKSGGGTRYDIYYKLNAEWITGEGYVGPRFEYGIPYSTTIATPFAVNGNYPNLLTTHIFSANPQDHDLRVSVNGNILLSDYFNGVNIHTYDTLFSSSLSDSTQITYQALGTQNNFTDINYLCWASLVYERQFTLDNQSSIRIGWQKPTDAYFRFEQADMVTSGWIYDLTEHRRISATHDNDTLKAIVPGSPAARELFLCTDQGLKSPIIEVTPSLGDLSLTNQGAELVIIAHPDLAFSALAYAQYKQSNTNNPVSTQIVWIQEIYNEFGYGSITPWAIKRFCKYAVDQWQTPPENFLLWGNGTHLTRNNPANLVPAYGFPASDWLYVSNYEPDTVDPAPIAGMGRLNFRDNDDALNYLAKVQQYESVSQADWMRNGVYLSGGVDTLEQRPIITYQETGMGHFESSPHYGRSHHFFRYDTQPDSTTHLSLKSLIDQGCSFIQFTAASADTLDHIPLGEPQQYNNNGRYPIIAGYSCLDASYRSNPSYAGRWLFAGQKGAVGFIGFPECVYLNPLGNLSLEFSKKAFDTLPGRQISQIMRDAMVDYGETYQAQLYMHHLFQWNYHGDPTLILGSAPADVWPGDANDDRIADIFDLLPIGLAHDSTGSVRPNASLSWQAQPSPFWNTYLGPDSLNYKFIDTDGNGTINADDTLAISLNYGLGHNKTFETSTTEGSVPLQIELSSDSAVAGDSIQIKVRLGTPQQIADSIYGLAFTLYYDPAFLDSNSVKIDLSQTWMGTPNQNLLTMAHHFPSLGRIDLGVTRTDHQDTSGQGIVATIEVVVIYNVSGKLTNASESVVVEAGIGKANDSQGRLINLGYTGQSFELVRATDLTPGIFCYPNPTQGSTRIELGIPTGQPCNLHIYDPIGKLQAAWVNPPAFLDVDVQEWQSGVYLLELETSTERWIQKLVVIR